MAFERANKAFLLTGEERFIAAAEVIVGRLKQLDDLPAIDDLERLKREIGTFILQARRSATGRKPGRRGRTKSASTSVDAGVAVEVADAVLRTGHDKAG